ncbi:ABC transporter substrate-binding protein [Variovorax sp. HJSM1_2]|uniref:ABC transporter substrate-binding protein n=1 Tax=Variovorax sp. HJSM1_2 TaxID=3366263 RepID=UPI003BDF5DE8
MKRRSLIAQAAMAATLATALFAPFASQAQDNKTLRVVPHANITILDPIWTTAFVTRNHGYMIYDTLFGTDLAGKVKPQMVDKWSVSKDNLSWTFTLRDGLEFHDGKPVTSEDVIASLKRWASRDAFGGVLAASVESYTATDAKTFVIKLNKPFGVMLEALGKPSSNVPFIMPARIAATPGSEQVKENIGSGPYKFVTAEYKPGERLVYVKNEKYKPRAEAPDGTTGGKNVYLDRVEWVIIRDPQTQFNALVAGEVDIIEQPTFEQYATLKATPNVKLVDAQPDGLQYIFRFNHLHAPFNNVKIREAAMVAMGQEAFLRTQVGAPGMYKFCKSMFPCGTPFASEKTGIFTGTANPQKAAQMLKEAGYNGTPVVLMRPTDLASIAKLPLVAKQQLEAAGFKVDMQQMDWSTLVARRAKKDAPDKGGWNAFMTAWTAGDILNPLTMSMLNTKGDNGWFGWQDDKTIEEMKGKFAQAGTDAEKKKIAEDIQLRAFETVTHVPLGQYNNPAAVRNNVSGIVPGGAQVYWNVKKN